jgi:hypothetical protein
LRRGLVLAGLATIVLSVGSVARAAPAGSTATITEPPGSAQSKALNSGTGGTEFGLRLPVGAACAGDSATQQYRVQTYIVPAAVDPATLVFDVGGPTPQATGNELRQPLYTADSQSPAVNITTAIGTGLIDKLPTFSLGIFSPPPDGLGTPPAGTYNIGVACTKGVAGPDQLDRYWNAQLTIAADGTDTVAGLRWTAGAPTPPTSSTSTTTSTTTTTVAVRSSTSTSTTSTTTSTSGTTSVATAAPAGATATGSSVDPPSAAAGASGSTARRTLPGTGAGDLWPMLFVAIAVLVLGRVAVLTGRRVRTLPRAPD